MMQMINAVEQLHSIGFVHCSLRSDVIFQSKDPYSPFFVDGLEYTTKISNNQINSKIPVCPIKIKIKDFRPGSKKQDMRVLAAILVAWQVGVDVNMDRLKKISNRLNFIDQYFNN